MLAAMAVSSGRSPRPAVIFMQADCHQGCQHACLSAGWQRQRRNGIKIYWRSNLASSTKGLALSCCRQVKTKQTSLADCLLAADPGGHLRWIPAATQRLCSLPIGRKAMRGGLHPSCRRGCGASAKRDGSGEHCPQLGRAAARRPGTHHLHQLRCGERRTSTQIFLAHSEIQRRLSSTRMTSAAFTMFTSPV